MSWEARKDFKKIYCLLSEKTNNFLKISKQIPVVYIRNAIAKNQLCIIEKSLWLLLKKKKELSW